MTWLDLAIDRPRKTHEPRAKPKRRWLDATASETYFGLRHAKNGSIAMVEPEASARVCRVLSPLVCMDRLTYPICQIRNIVRRKRCIDQRLPRRRGPGSICHVRGNGGCLGNHRFLRTAERPVITSWQEVETLAGRVRPAFPRNPFNPRRTACLRKASSSFRSDPGGSDPSRRLP